MIHLRLKFFAFILILIFELSAQSELQRMTLSEAVEHAFTNSPEFQILTNQKEIAALEEKIAFARHLPSLDLTATHGILDSEPPPTYHPWTSDFKLTLSQSIYNNGVNYKNYEIAQLQNSAAQLSFKEQQNHLTLDIATQFVNYSLNLKLIEVQATQLELFQKQLDIFSKTFSKGKTAKNDYVRLQIQVKRSEIIVATANALALKSKEDLVRLLGFSPLQTQEIDFIPTAFENVKNDIQVKNIDLTEHLQYQISEIQKKISALTTELISRKRFPDWDLSAGVSYGSSDYVNTNRSFKDNEVTEWNALLTLKYNLLDWGIRSKDAGVALQKNLTRKNEIERQLANLKATLLQLVVQINKLQKNYELSKDLLKLEKSNIEFIERQYRDGKVQYLDLVTSLASLSDAKTIFLTNLADLQIAKYTLLYHQGKLVQEIK